MLTLTNLQEEVHRYLKAKEKANKMVCLIVVRSGENREKRFGITTALVQYESTKPSKLWLTQTMREKARLEQMGERQVVLVDASRGFNPIGKMVIIDSLTLGQCDTEIIWANLMVPMLYLEDTFCVLVVHMSPNVEERYRDKQHICGFREYLVVSDDGLTIVQHVRA